MGYRALRENPRPYFDSEVFIEFTYRKILCDFINKYLWDTTLVFGPAGFKKLLNITRSQTAP